MSRRRDAHGEESGARQARPPRGTPAALAQPVAQRALASGAPLTPQQVSALQSAAGNAALVQRLARDGAGAAPGPAGVVQRVESPPRGRGGYEADASSSGSDHGRDSDSSREREELHHRMQQGMAGLGDIGDLVQATESLEPRGLRRIRNLDPDAQPMPAFVPDSDRAAAAPGTASAAPAAPAESSLPELPGNTLLGPLRNLLMEERRVGGAGKKLKVTLKVEEADLRRERPGHTWIEVNGSEGAQVSFGFYPHGDWRTLTGVDGGVVCPDPHRRFTNRESANVPLSQVFDGYQVAHEKVLADYHLALYNCTSFAGEVWKAMTGRNIPTDWIGTLVANPTSTSEAVAGRQGTRRDNRLPGMESRMEGPMRGVVPLPGDRREVAGKLVEAGISQSSSSESTEEVD
ncbi:hypothetical protein [Streptomyces boncukensis]|uniref:Uncharacterized protein n=1 Tax=Streptomyces boncukensis TaxID=2711219 RepID=A0A6G4WZJ0_9ACTN|nr:hypothetical protein [Streptomyces boncukensis]NGO70655.1 hypothetical protein [Streptomyces boncukensis]